MLRKIRGHLERDNGVVAVEFAMLTLPFIVLLMGIVEVALFFTAGFVLEGGTTAAARLVRTGEAVDSGDPEGAFAAELCSEVSRIIPCDEIIYEAIPMGDAGFGGAEEAGPAYDANGDLVADGFDAGGSGEVVLIRAFHRYHFLIPMIGTLITGDPEVNSAVLMSTAVIRNEPYEFGGG